MLQSWHVPINQSNKQQQRTKTILPTVRSCTLPAVASIPVPAALALGPGGVLLHAATGRPVPHSCVLGAQGGLLSSDGKPLPDSMAVGPNR